MAALTASQGTAVHRVYYGAGHQATTVAAVEATHDTKHKKGCDCLPACKALFNKVRLLQVFFRMVWPLTQFYSVIFSQSRIRVKSVFLTETQSRFASVVIYGVLGHLS